VVDVTGDFWIGGVVVGWSFRGVFFEAQPGLRVTPGGSHPLCDTRQVSPTALQESWVLLRILYVGLSGGA